MNKDNEYRPKFNVPFSKADYAIELSALLGIILNWVLPLIFYFQLPEIITTHYGIDGKPNDWGSKNSIFILPVISTILYIGLTILNRFPHIFNYPVKVTPDNFVQLYIRYTRIIRVMKLVIILIFIFIEWQVCKVEGDGALPVWFMMLIIGVPVVLPVILAFVFTSKYSSGKK